MNFNIDDPLADLLSDNSLLNDNFFEQNNEGSKASGSRNLNKSASSTKPKIRLEDWFDAKEGKDNSEEQSTKKSSATNFNFGNKNTPLASSTPLRRKGQSNIAQDDDDSNDDDLGFDPKAPKSAMSGTTKFDDWINKLDTPKKPVSASGALGGTKKSEQTKPIISRQSTDTTTDQSYFLQPQSRPKSSAGRRSSAQSSNLQNSEINQFDNSKSDLFSNFGASEKPSSGKKYSNADWLGLNQSEVKEVPSKESVQQKDNISDSQNAHTEEKHQEKNEETIAEPRLSARKDITPTEVGFKAKNFVDSNLQPATIGTDNTLQNILVLGNRTLETNHAFQTLQHQESQLAVAAQIKAHEVALLELQHKQEEALKHQEQQFQTLLQQQILRQQQMEDHIRLQQQRINTHIEMLMNQPAILSQSFFKPSKQDEMVLPSSRDDNVSKSNAEVSSPSNDMMEIEIKKLELEKLRLEDLLENVRANYEKEIDLLNHSFKKQLEVVQEHREAVEQRLKAELENCKEHYSAKLRDLEAEYNKYKNDMEANLEGLQGDHEDQLRKLRKAHEDDLDMLKEEHRRMLERIRQTKTFEFATVQGAGNYLETLKAASSSLDHISGDLQGIRDEMQNKINLLHDEKERQLELRERRLEDKERHLKINEETTDAEKKRLMDLVSTLELQLSHLAKDAAEENWQIRTKMSSLEAEKLAFEREKEFMREQFRRDEKRLEELKEFQLAEQQRKLLDIQEERMALAIERKKFEAERKLHDNSDFSKQRLEVEAQFVVAQNAIKQADAERDRYMKLQRGLEQQQRVISEKDNALSSKEAELENCISQCRLSESKAQATIKKTQQMEQQFLAKIQLFQKRLRQLNEREANLAQERFLVTQERIALHKAKNVIGERNCALCKLATESIDINEVVRNAQMKNSDNLSGMNVPVEVKSSSNALDLVDRLLDDNIEESLRRMKSNVNLDVDFWNEYGLDDDTKKIINSNFDGNNINDTTIIWEA